jgi:hypothetical protein
MEKRRGQEELGGIYSPSLRLCWGSNNVWPTSFADKLGLGFLCPGGARVEHGVTGSGTGKTPRGSRGPRKTSQGPGKDRGVNGETRGLRGHCRSGSSLCNCVVGVGAAAVIVRAGS